MTTAALILDPKQTAELTPSAISQNKIKRDCVLARALKKVLSFLKRVQSFLLPWKKSIYDLSDAQIRLRNRLQQGLIAKTLQIKPKETHEIMPIAPHRANQIAFGSTEFKHQFVPLPYPLNEVPPFLKKITNNIIDEAYAHYVAPSEEKIKLWLEKIPTAIKPAIDTVIQVFNRSTKPIFSRLRNVPTRINSCAEKAAEDFILLGDKADSYPFLKWACQAQAFLKKDKMDHIKKDVTQYLLNVAHSEDLELDEIKAVMLTEQLAQECIYLQQEFFNLNESNGLKEKGWKYFVSRALDLFLKDNEALQQGKITDEFREWLLHTDEGEVTKEDAKKLLKEHVVDIKVNFTTGSAIMDVEIGKALRIVFDTASPTPVIKRAVAPNTLSKRVFSALISLLIEKKFKKTGIGFEELEKTSQNLHNWLLQEKMDDNSYPTDTIAKEELIQLATEKTISFLKKRSHAKPQLPAGYHSIENHIKLIVEWFFETTRVPLDERYDPAHYDVEIIETAFEKVLQLLLQKKIHSFFTRWQRTFTDNLTDIIQNKIMKENVQTIVGIMIERILLLLDSSDYTGIFDSLVEVIHTFAQSYLDAQVREQINQEAIKRERQVAAAIPKNATESRIQAEAIQRLNRINRIGETDFLEAEFLNDFVLAQRDHTTPTTKEKLGLKGFTERVLGLVKNSSEATLHKDKPDYQRHYENEQNRIAREILNDTAEKFLKLVFPPQTKTLADGTVKTVDGILYLAYQLGIPSEVMELVGECDKMVSEIFPLALRSFFKKTLEGAKPHIMGAASNYLREQIQAAIVDVLHKVFVNTAQPEEILRLLCEFTLPMLNKGMVEGIAFEGIYYNRKQYAALFVKWLKKEIEVNELYRQIVPSLANYVTSSFHEFKESKKTNEARAGVSTEVTSGFIKKCSESITSLTEVASKTIGSLTGAISKKEIDPNSGASEYQGEVLEKRLIPAIDTIASWLYHYYAEELKSNPNYQLTNEKIAFSIEAYKKNSLKKSEHIGIYGELIYNLLFRIGGFNLGYVLKTVDMTVKNELGKLIGASVSSYRLSYHNLIDYLLRTLTEKFSEESLKELFNKSVEFAPTYESDADREARIKKIKEAAIDRTSRLMYDTSPAALKLFVGGNANEFNKTLTNVLEKIFSSYVLNRGIFYSIAELVIKKLEESAEKIGSRDTLPTNVTALNPNDFVTEETLV